MPDPNDTFLRRLLLTVGVTALTIVVLFLLWRAANVFLLAFAGLLFGVLLLSIANLFSRRTPLEGHGSLFAALLLVVLLLAGAGWLVGPRLAGQISSLSQGISEPLGRIEAFLAQYGWGDRLLESAPGLEALDTSSGGGASPQTPSATPSRGGASPASTETEGSELDELPLPEEDLLSNVFSFLSTVVGVLADLLLVVFFGIFLAANPDLYKSGIVKLFPPERRERAEEVMNELGKTLQLWLLGKFVSMLIVGVLTGLGLWALGVPLVLVLALIAFLLEFIPFIGPWLSGVPAVLLALSESPTKALWVIGLYLLVQQIEGNLILPLVQRRAVELPPALTLLAIFVMGALFGFMGLFVATPVAAVVVVVVKMLYLKDRFGDRVKLPGHEAKV